jgi:hypothetical protein
VREESYGLFACTVYRGRPTLPACLQGTTIIRRPTWRRPFFSCSVLAIWHTITTTVAGTFCRGQNHSSGRSVLCRRMHYRNSKFECNPNNFLLLPSLVSCWYLERGGRGIIHRCFRIPALHCYLRYRAGRKEQLLGTGQCVIDTHCQQKEDVTKRYLSIRTIQHVEEQQKR